MESVPRAGPAPHVPMSTYPTEGLAVNSKHVIAARAQDGAVLLSKMQGYSREQGGHGYGNNSRVGRAETSHMSEGVSIRGRWRTPLQASGPVLGSARGKDGAGSREAQEAGLQAPMLNGISVWYTELGTDPWRLMSPHSVWTGPPGPAHRVQCVAPGGN